VVRFEAIRLSRSMENAKQKTVLMGEKSVCAERESGNIREGAVYMSECVETRRKINEMFSQLTLESIDSTRAEIDPHLLKCRECREFLIEMYERKRERFEKNA
jgi:hypothetical protein